MTASSAAKATLDPTAMPIPDTARLLSRVCGLRITEEMLREDCDDGAPVNPDGTLHLVHYAAWLVRELLRGE